MKYKIFLLIFITSFFNFSWADKSSIEVPHGKFITYDRNSNIVLAAPHGTFDISTAKILNKVCLKSEFSCIIAKGFVPNKIRLNVNRPTEGFGMHSSKEPRTDRAKATYEKYKSLVYKVADGEPKFYIELHGSPQKDMELYPS